ncbi:SspB-related isopeptide-forming adhesin [Limosilactobacillus ingluviei]|uniref:SspB-related isopeptide-forming adhesin n=1 Tax=Limosilactobacillus ingluviei TaxID=148604 RepID=UPI0023F302D0|nr:SspB-related isopeptide-forming adhesin [Limosilactobacillus ingluviei]
MEQWRGTNPLNPNGLTAAEVKQHLTLGREPQAKATYHVLNPELKFFGEFFDSNLGADAKKQDYQSSVSIPGPVITVTFTNLKNSYYVDNAGHKKFITKIERTFSDLQKAPSFPENSAILSINEDPTDGFWFDFSNGVTVSDTFYDENNQPISIDGNGWLAVTSLNAMYGGIRENQTLSGSPFHVEQVTPIHGGQSYALAGSSISVHSDGSLYADKTNFSAINYDGSTNDSITKKGVSAWPDNKRGWDGKGPDEYFGAGLIKINGSQITLNFKLAHTEDPVWNPYVWATMSTIIPQTPTPEYNVPEKPILETTTTSYHYNVVNVERPGLPETFDVNYHYDKVNYTPEIDKHLIDGSAIIDNGVLSDGSMITWSAEAELPIAANFAATGGLKSVVITEDYSQFADKVKGAGSFKVMQGSKDVTSDWNISDNHKGTATLTLKDPNKAVGQTIKVEPVWTLRDDLPDATPFTNKITIIINNTPGETSTTTGTVFAPEPKKDVTTGDNAVGDKVNSINGKEVAAGSVLSYPLSLNNVLPAGRVQDVTGNTWEDTLNSALAFKSYRAFLKDANGNYTDVTSHIKLARDGQKLTFTDDAYLQGLYNKDKSKAFNLPVINLVVTANESTKVIPNNYVLITNFKDANGKTTTTKTSNTVNVSTFVSAPHKDVAAGNDLKGDANKAGVSINGQMVVDGSPVTWALTDQTKLPANRVQPVTSHVLSGTLDNKLEYMGYKAFLDDGTGTLVDVTSHVTLKREGQKLTFTDDSYLINLFNKDMSKAQAVPIIDLVTRVHGKSGKINNNFNATWTFKNGNTTTTVSKISNTVGITPYVADPVKDVELGDGIIGDPAGTINKAQVADGTVVTYALSDKTGLPATRAQNVKQHTISDTLEDGVKYVSYKAYLKDSQGKMTDVTSHVKLTQEGQKLTFTDDQYLLDLYNKDKSTAMNVPIIDLVASIHGDAVPRNNKFISTFLYANGKKDVTSQITSNTVTVTPFQTKPTKDVELGGNVKGDTAATINGQAVMKGSTVTFVLTDKQELPAGRVQDVIASQLTDELDEKVEYQGFHAYLPVNGQLTDVTSHVSVKQNGQTVVFTPDQYIMDQYNKDKSKAQGPLQIDLEVKVIGETGKIDNKYQLDWKFKSGNTVTNVTRPSNEVEITPYDPQPTKDVELGHGVVGDPDGSVNGKAVADGTQLTYPLSDKTGLLANRAQDVKSHVLSGTLSDNLTYVNYKAYLTDKDGKKIDVTAHVKLTRDGQKLTFTDDKYLLDLYNKDKKSAMNVPVIDLETVVHGDLKDVKNKFTSSYLMSDGDRDVDVHEESNEVTVTPYESKPAKDVELGTKSQGNTDATIDGQTVSYGTKLNFPLYDKQVLPANRAQDVISRTLTGTLDPKLEYLDYRAYLVQADGTKQDVTDHVSVKQDGQKISFTDDAYLIGLYNKDKTKAIEPVEINLIAKVIGKSGKIENTYVSNWKFKSGENVTEESKPSNTVSIYTFNSQPTKDVELGDHIQGDPEGTVDGKQVADGSVLTYPLSEKSGLPANRAQDVKSHVMSGTLADNLTYKSFRAYLEKADGSKEDVTDHILLTKDGQKLTFTDDAYLLGIYNKDKKSAMKMPTIDLVTVIHGDGVATPNKFTSKFVWSNGATEETELVNDSNVVTVTPFTSKPTKDVELGSDVLGNTENSVAGQVVAKGSKLSYPLEDKQSFPANRAQNIKSRVLVDTLPEGLTYQSYRAYLPDANGKMQDVTNHVLLTKSAQQLTFTDDKYLIDLYNADKSAEVKKPVINLVVTADGEQKTLPNKFDSHVTYENGDGEVTENTTSNEVTVSTYNSDPVKDVELGDNVKGDTENSIAGSVVPNGTVVTWPLSNKNDLPANRAQDIISHTVTDVLDANLEYHGFTAWLKGEDGKMTEVTNHVNVVQDGQKLTFTDDSYLIGIYNKDKSKAQALPVIDLKTKAIGDSKLIPNKFEDQLVFQDGNGNTTITTNSNEVSISTADVPTPTKSETDENGKTVDRQQLKAGQHLMINLGWDLSKYKGIVTTDDMIKKGFFFLDPLDAKALAAGDLTKATVKTSDGKPVEGVEFTKYDSLSDAPEYIQEQVKANHLANLFQTPFVVASATDPEAFFNTYVKAGAKLNVAIPVTIKDGFTGSFSNTAYQFEFGRATPTNTVTNYVAPEPKAPQTPQPATPAQPAPQLATPSAPAPAAPQKEALPQTGNAQDSLALIALGAAMLSSSFALGALGMKKRHA